GELHAEAAGRERAPDHIEPGRVRPMWGAPGIHYAVNCSSLGCPNLSPRVYTASNMEAQLEAGAAEYINHPRGVDFVDEDFIVISGIYDWFVVDFGNSEQKVFEHLIRYAESELAGRLKGFTGVVEYEYDWALNQPDQQR
ncbi:MAG: DUF547 domain-containing protein, partial [Rhodospirillaceae bacterium]|nr:DUF547 domain-containing protein [Rhodospirillaceae bacterium]